MTPWERFEHEFFSPFQERWRGKALHAFMDPAVLDRLSKDDRARAAERLAASLAVTNDPRRLQGLTLLDPARATVAARGIVAREVDPDRRVEALVALLYLDADAPEGALLPSLLAVDARESVRVHAVHGLRRMAQAHPDAGERDRSREALFQALLDPALAVREAAWFALHDLLRLRRVVPTPDPGLERLRSDRRDDRGAGAALVRGRADRVRVDPFSRDLLRAHLRELCVDAPGACPRCAEVMGEVDPGQAGMDPISLPPFAHGQALYRCPACRRPIFYRYVHEGWYVTGHEESWTVVRDDALERFVDHPEHASARWLIRLDDRLDLSPLDG